MTIQEIEKQIKDNKNILFLSQEGYSDYMMFKYVERKDDLVSFIEDNYSRDKRSSKIEKWNNSRYERVVLPKNQVEIITEWLKNP